VLGWVAQYPLVVLDKILMFQILKEYSLPHLNPPPPFGRGRK